MARGGSQKRRVMVQTRRPPQPLPFAHQVAIFSRLAGANPSPQTELVFSNPFTLVVAVA